MARRRAFIRRGVKRKGDLVWITTVVSASILEATPTDIALLVIPSDWGNQQGFDRATVMGIRGWLGTSQQAAATAADATGAYQAIYVTDQGISANSMDASSATEYQDFDVLWTDGISLTQTTGTAGFTVSRQLDIKARRKITSASALKLAMTVDGDTGTPRVNVNGVVRTLLKLTP